MEQKNEKIEIKFDDECHFQRDEILSSATYLPFGFLAQKIAVLQRGFRRKFHHQMGLQSTLLKTKIETISKNNRFCCILPLKERVEHLYTNIRTFLVLLLSFASACLLITRR